MASEAPSKTASGADGGDAGQDKSARGRSEGSRAGSGKDGKAKGDSAVEAGGKADAGADARSSDSSSARPRRGKQGTPVKNDDGGGIGQSGGTSQTGLLLGAAAAGVAIGLIANLGRKAAVQAPTLLAGDWDAALAAEHRATLKLFDALEATGGTNGPRRTILLMQLKHALAKHALEEENAIYPALREAGQTEEADRLNGEHGYVKQYLYELEKMPKDGPGFRAKLAEFRAAIEAHMRDEEDRIFPRLKAGLDAAANKKLTALMNKEGFKLA